ncbi:hypothetical protein MMC07_003960 [Pseudocyphellaria aurata]|nr:hypothetical protein [Pseudocyphellaria aurata]
MAPRARPRKRVAETASQNLRARKRISYKESNSASDKSDQIVESSSDESASADDLPRRRRPTATSRCLTKASNKRRALPVRVNASRIHQKSAREDKSSDHDETNSKETDNVPPWQSLPYHILTQIFLYASPRLGTKDFFPNTSVLWFLECARLCRSFAEPALSALYYSPPLRPPTRARGLIRSLTSQTEHSTFNYRSKVKYLDVEADINLWRKYKGQDPISLEELIRLTPQLRGLRIHVAAYDLTRKHGIFAYSNPKAIYQKSILTALQTQRIALREWIWNAETAVRHSLREIHSTSTFQSLRTLVFNNFGPAVSTEDELAYAIKALPHLKGLVFRLSHIVNQKLLPLLPHRLESLEIVDCSSLTSRMLSQFLTTHGQELLQLILDHNQALNLSFLTDFAAACPKIQNLKMNLRFYNSHVTFHDLDPKFDALLEEDETPTWPASLADLDLLHLRKWNLDVAECFFSSLVDSANALTKLRRLNIKASLDESGWRDRVNFRDKWTSRLEQVFLRVSEPPSPHLKSMAAFKAYKHQLLAQNYSVDNHKLGAEPKTERPSLRVVPKRGSKFSHVEIRENMPKKTTHNQSDNDAPLVEIRRSRRLKQQDMSKCTRRAKCQRGSDESSSGESGEDDDDEYMSPKVSSSLHRRRHRRRKKGSDESSSSEDSALDDDATGQEPPDVNNRFASKQDGFHIQGLCDVVNVLFDNLRPTEEQLNESDFLDDERSGDEDWNGNDDDMGEDGYAW